jgi:hypothetical protein
LGEDKNLSTLKLEPRVLGCRQRYLITTLSTAIRQFVQQRWLQGSWHTSLLHLAHTACDSNILVVYMHMTLTVTGVVEGFIKKTDL